MDGVGQIVPTRDKFHPRITFQLVLLDDQKIQVCVDKTITGADVFDKICKGLNLAEESAYFGLSFTHAKGDFIWIRMEESILKQLRHADPLIVWMRVKFVVSPDDLVLSDTKYLFYLHFLRSLKGNLATSGLTLALQAHLAALLSCTQDGPAGDLPLHYSELIGLPLDECPTAQLESTSKIHQNLLGLTQTETEMLFLNFVFSHLPDRQRFYYKAKDVFYRPVRLGVGPQGVVILTTESSLLEEFSFSRLTAIGTIQSVLTLFTPRADGSQRADHFKLPSRQHAENAFWHIRETSCFLRGEVVEVRDVFPGVGKSLLWRRRRLQGKPQCPLTQSQVCQLARARASNEITQSNTDLETGWPMEWHLSGDPQSPNRRFKIFRRLQGNRSEDYKRLR
nr:unnamed protein product [Spirometra erinaceieuropaei]